mmetsp:Transcript_118869/g.233479  ORF Transcript_118869/g.233479 Transcript_118869/m.233479 type:complete len:717 (+) Transcript_118869:46-2196(+)
MRAAAFIALLFGAVACDGAKVESAANPIRKVVTMLQKMQQKVTEEGKREEDLYEKFMCYCKNSGNDLAQSIADAEAKIENVAASLEESAQRKDQLTADLKDHTTNRDDAKDTMAKATALREKEEAAHAKEKSDLETNLAAIAKAVAALEKGASGSFLQTPSARIVRSWAMEKADLPDQSRQELLAFLSGTQAEGYVPQSGEITGILKQIADEMSQSLSDAIAVEENAIKTYEGLMAAKKKEVATLQAQIEDKMTRMGELGVQSAEMSNDVEDTKQALEADKKFKQELEQGCATKTQEWEEIKKTRAEELLALAETIKVLNDDDALEIFKKTLPSASASFVQVQVTSASQRSRALALLRKESSRRPELDLIALALSGKKGGFGKVLAMIDEMVENLKAEQKDDDQKQQYCNTQFDQSDDKRKQLEQSIKDSETAIDEMEGAIKTLAEEMAALEAGIKKLDKAVAEATEQRQNENVDYKSLMASNGAAKELLHFAKNRLNKFYNPKLYKAPPKVELSSEDRIYANNGGEITTAAPGGIAGTGIAVLAQIAEHRTLQTDAPAPPPETWGAYAKKSEEGNGVIAMIDLLVKDLDKEMMEAATSEKEAQADYETMMSDSAAKRATDTKALTEKGAAKADMESDLEGHTTDKKTAGSELMAAMKYAQSLHAECDWLMQYYDVRKTARADEVDSLHKAKAVLNGADFALVQTRAARNFLQRRA